MSQVRSAWEGQQVMINVIPSIRIMATTTCRNE